MSSETRGEDEAADELMGSGYWINPLCEDLYSEEDFQIEISNAGIATCAEESSYYTTEKQAVETLRENMRLRNATITFSYQTDQALTVADLRRWAAEATAETERADEGDYLLRHMSGYGYGWTGQILTSNGQTMYRYDIQYNVMYFTTYAQEMAVQSKVSSLMTELGITSAVSDYEKTKLIYDYICKNVTYDYTNLENGSYLLKYSAYAALINKTAVCQGYANLFYYMAKTAGLNVRLLTGTANGGGHAWNIVKLGKKYYLLDTTWDASTAAAGLAYRYFLKGSTEFSKDHTLDSGYTTEEFSSSYPISTKDYEPGDSDECTSHDWETSYTVKTRATMSANGQKVIYCKYCDEIKPNSEVMIPKISTAALSTTLYTYSGKTITPTITVKDANGTALQNGTDYTVSGTPSAVNVGTYTITFTFKGSYSGSKTLSYRIQPAAPSSISAVLSAYTAVKLSWGASAGATSYNVYYKTSSASTYTKIGNTTATSINKTGLAEGTVYTFKVVPCYAGQTEATTYKTASAITLKKMAAPSVSKASATVVKISWTAISGATGYQVSRSTSKTGTTVVGNYTGTSVQLTPSYNVACYYKVRPYKTVGSGIIYGPWSDVKVYQLNYVATAANVKANLNAYNSVKVTWSKVTGANQYSVYYKKASAKSYTYLGKTTGASYTKTKLSAGVKYSFKVVPQYASSGKVQTSGTAKTASVYTLKKMSTPKVARNATTKVKISWTKISGASGYQISRSTSKSGTSICATITNANTSSKVVSATRKKNFYYKVRAYKVVNGKKIYGPWSSVKSYKLK